MMTIEMLRLPVVLTWQTDYKLKARGVKGIPILSQILNAEHLENFIARCLTNGR